MNFHLQLERKYYNFVVFDRSGKKPQ